MKYIPMMTIFAIALMLIAGLVVDGDGKINAAQNSVSIAQGAARAGTNAATGAAVNGDAFDLSGSAAVNAANNFITAAGATGNAELVNNQVVAHVTETYTTVFLPIIGINTLTASATASARLVDQN